MDITVGDRVGFFEDLAFLPVGNSLSYSVGLSVSPGGRAEGVRVGVTDTGAREGERDLVRFLVGGGLGNEGDGVVFKDGIRVCVSAEFTVPKFTKTFWNLAKSTDPSPVAGSHPGVA